MECNCCNVFMFCIIDCDSDVSRITRCFYMLAYLYSLLPSLLSENILLEVFINCDYILDSHTSLSWMHSVLAV
jgi:hypothetical protein